MLEKKSQFRAPRSSRRDFFSSRLAALIEGLFSDIRTRSSPPLSSTFFLDDSRVLRPLSFLFEIKVESKSFLGCCGRNNGVDKSTWSAPFPFFLSYAVPFCMDAFIGFFAFFRKTESVDSAIDHAVEFEG